VIALGLCLATLAVYVETRVWLLLKFPYFLDEAILGYYAQQGLHNADARLIPLEAGDRPGMSWLTMGVMWLLHVNPLVAIRIVAVAFGVLTVVAGAVAAYRYVGRVAAIAYAVLSLFTPFFFLYDALGLRETVMAALIVTAFLLQIELAREPRFAIGFLLGLTFALGLVIQDTVKLAFYLLPVSLAYFPFRSPRRLRLAAAWIGNVAFAFAFAFVGTLPLKLTSAYSQLHALQESIGLLRSFTAIRAHPLRYFDQSWPAVHVQLTDYLTWPVVVVLFVGLALGLRRQTRFTIVAAVWGLVQLATVLLAARNQFARYLAPVIPFALLLAAIGVQDLVRIAGGAGRSVRRVAIGAAVLGAAALVPALIFDEQVSYDAAAAGYPPIDRVQYITGYTSGYGETQTVDELALLAAGRHLTVIENSALEPWQLEVISASRGLDIEWVSQTDPDAAQAQALVTDGSPFPEGVTGFHEVWRYTRPQNGTPIVVYARS
jgi:hypothetical protein